MGLLFREGLAFEESVAYLERAAANAGEDIIILSNLAGTLGRLGEFPRAMEVLQQVIDIVTKNRDGMEEEIYRFNIL